MIDWIKNNTTLAIAIYGAVLSTIALVWNIYNSSKDKPKVKVTAKFGFTSSAIGTSGHLLIVTAVNKGKRSVYLSSMGLRSRKDDLLNLNTIGLPCELKGGGSHSEWFEVSKLKKDRQYDFGWFKDATGKMYKSKSIKKKIENYFKSSNVKKELVK
ncbi:MAG: hypothetical protein Q7S27_00705 [Nanoarchaeota archaeon]|nr:hypothetical protein [Nanoarchaeota archaeon]